MPKQAVFTVLQRADAFIIAAKRTDLYRYGISPNKLHEYMAAARPTVVAASSNNNPIMEASAGITVAPEDAEAIAQAIVDLAAMSAEDRWKMGLRGRQYVEKHHDFASLAVRLEGVLSSALDSRIARKFGTRAKMSTWALKWHRKQVKWRYYTMRPRRIIVNADDFGMNSGNNQAIVDGFRQRLNFQHHVDGQYARL